MLEAITAIQEYTAGMTQDEFANDGKTVRAVLHALIVIGEAAVHLPDEVCVRHDAVDWASMRAMRNILVHEYFGADVTIVWRTVQDDLPGLIPEFERIVSSAGT